MKPKFLILFFLVLFISCKKESNRSRQQKIEIISKRLSAKKIDDLSKIKNLDTLYYLLLEEKKDIINYRKLFKISGLYYEVGQFDKYLLVTKDIYNRATVSKDTIEIAKSLYFIGDYYENNFQNDSAFIYYARAEKFYRLIDDNLNTGRTLLYKSGILYDAGIFTESEVQTSNALRFLIKAKDSRLIYESNNLMALNLMALNNYEDSLKYFNFALEKLDEMEMTNYPKEKLVKSRASIYNNIGNLFEKKGEHIKAVEFYNKGLLTSNLRHNYPQLYAMLLDNLAYSKMKSGALNNVERLFKESSMIRDSLQIKSGIVTGQIHLGEFYIKMNDTVKGLFYLEKGYRKAREIESTYDIKNALKILSLNDKIKGDHYTKLYIKLNDSLQTVERHTRNKFARIAYETDQVEEKNENLIKKYTSTVVLFSVALLFIGTVFIIYRLRSKNKELQLIHEQQESNEKIYQLILQQADQNQSVRDEERNRIALELHDGIVNRIFTTRYNLMNLKSEDVQQKDLLVQELLLSEAEIRKVSHDLQQNLLFENTSFQNAIGLLVANQRNDFETEFDYSIDKYIDWSAVPSTHKVHIYRIIQEALQNVHKYAQASKCSLYILKKGGQILLQISDNGVGFDQENSKSGIGLRNIAQRTKNMDGTYTIISDATGTVIEIWI
ncbi:tetratricopeptide repeat-containing sensor histidine kinase [Flavobacterium tegetincola]|uniref:tetratricopeptide repeat-containing sensor histidine kinase n=1 Tax=Flavobacterium tegetincola TaxID=150172 RepID=UPI00041B61EA|nr:tetratricopeptide repeat-containing sensor histidine kinase [Flavobacterium tegetincola]